MDSLTQIVLGASVGEAVLGRKVGNKALLYGAIAGTIPDLDVFASYFTDTVTALSMHRGFTHSILFALLWALVFVFAIGRKNKLLWGFTIFLSTLSHGIFDAMTTGGRGVGFFIPFNNERFFFPFRMIKVSPISISDFFSEWGMSVIFSEIKYLGIPCILILVFLYFKRKYK